MFARKEQRGKCGSENAQDGVCFLRVIVRLRGKKGRKAKTQVAKRRDQTTQRKHHDRDHVRGYLLFIISFPFLSITLRRRSRSIWYSPRFRGHGQDDEKACTQNFSEESPYMRSCPGDSFQIRDTFQISVTGTEPSAKIPDSRMLTCVCCSCKLPCIMAAACALPFASIT